MYNRSLEIQRKPNSHTKLPKIDSYSIDSKKDNNIIKMANMKSGNTSKSQKEMCRNSVLTKLQPLKNSPSQKIKIAENLKGINAGKLSELTSRQKTGIHKINLMKRNTGPNHIIDINQKKVEDKKIDKITNKTINSQRTKSEGSSRQASHVVYSLVSNLISPKVQSQLIPQKLYSQKKMGDTLVQWWCVVDTLLNTLQKIIKIKKITDQKNRAESPTKGQSLKKADPPLKKNKKNSKQQSQPIKGKALTNIKHSLELAHAYSCLESQLIYNQRIALKAFEDPNHINLVLEAIFYEKACMFLLGSIKKWHHQDQKFYIHSLANEFIPCIRQNRKLLADIIMQAVENQRQDTKIRKPKYIAREKKLIQISKFVNLMKQSYENCMKYLGSPNRYKIFHLPQDGFKEHDQLIKKQISWRHQIFSVPGSPYISNPLNSGGIIINGHKLKKKQYLLILEPVGILYKYNKKQQTLHICPYAENFLSQLSEYFHIILFTHNDKDESLLNFMGCLQNHNIQIPFLFDKEFLRYRRGKLIKDISKIGGGQQFIWDQQTENYGKIMILDEKSNSDHYFHFNQKQRKKLCLIQGNHPEVRQGRVGGRIVKFQEDKEDFLKNLSEKIIKSVAQGGDWNSIIKQHKK